MDTVVQRTARAMARDVRVPVALAGPGGTHRRPAAAAAEGAEGRTVLAELDVLAAHVWNYARVSDDYNPIHLNDRAARFFGLRGSISHGMWSLARSRPVRRRHPPAGAQLETQFLTPVQLPARVTIKEWIEDGASRRAMCDVRTGRVHMYAYWTD